MATPRETLKYYFRKYALPTEEQFGELIDAFVHKDEDMLTQEKIDGLTAALESKLSSEDFATAQAALNSAIEALQQADTTTAERLTAIEDDVATNADNIAGTALRVSSLESTVQGIVDGGSDTTLYVKQIADLDTYEGTTGEIVQYIGQTTSTRTRGFFYERKEGEKGGTREYTLLGEAYSRGNVSSYNHGIDAEVYNRISEWLPDQAFNPYEYQKCYRTGETVRGSFSKSLIELAGQYKVGGILAVGDGAYKIAEIVTENGMVRYKDQDGSAVVSILEEYIDPATGEFKDEYNVDANVYATPSGKKIVFFEDSTTYLAMALDDDLTPLFAFQIAFPVDGYQLYTEEDSTPTPASWQVIPVGPCVN
jgi:hypothetical protein